MSRTLSNPNAGSIFRGKLPVANGGSGQDTAPLALATFNGVPASQYGANNGVAGLDSTGHLPYSMMPAGVSSSIGLSGPTTLYLGAKGVWTINNYDSSIAYSVSCTQGFVTQSGDKIYYTAPSTAGAAGFTVNNKVIPVTVSARYITKPTITSPVAEMTNAGAGVVITTDGFNIQGGFPETILTASDKATGDQFGVRVALSDTGDRLAVSAFTADVTGLTDAGAVYVYTKSGSVWSQEAKLTASDKATGDQFGYNIAMTGDSTRIVVTAPTSTQTGLTNAGCMYVFSRSGTTWTQEQKLTASDKAAGDYLGYAVSITDDGTRILVGANNASVSGITNCGTAYTFSRSGTVWSQEAKLSASDKAVADYFGQTAAISKDGTRCIVGAYNKTIGGLTAAGQVYVFLRTGTTWAQEAILSTSDKAAGDGFSFSLNICSDGSRVASSSMFKNSNTGAVYVFSRSGTVWTQEQKIIASDVNTNDLFGSAITFLNDSSRLAISAKAKPVNNITKAGQVYIYTRSDTSWNQEAIISSSDKLMNDYYGTTLFFNSTGTELAIGASSKSPNSILNAGEAYVYDMAYHASTDWQLSTDAGFTNIIQQSLADATNKNNWAVTGLSLNTDYYLRCRKTGTAYGTSDWSDTTHFSTRQSWLPINEQQKFTGVNKAASTWYGFSHAISRDGLTLIIGSNGTDSGSLVDSGAVYVYKKSNIYANWSLSQTLTAGDITAGAQFGALLSLSDDGNRLSIAAHTHTESGISQCGAVYIFTNNGTTWTQEAKLLASDRATNDRFGSWQKISGDSTRIVISSYLADISGQVDAGAVYVFSRSGTTWAQEQKITLPSPNNSDQFGTGVSINTTGDRIIAGCHLRDINSVADSGLVVTYTRTGTTWSLEASILNPDAVASDYFGSGIAMTPDGSRVAIGCVYKDVGGVSNCGAVYIFTRSGTTWTLEQKITASDKATNDYFGSWYGLAINDAGDIIAVGAFNKTVNGLAAAGQVYLFKRTGAIWTEEAKMSASDAAASDAFSKSITLSSNGDNLFVSSSESSPSGIYQAGAAYNFQ